MTFYQIIAEGLFFAFIILVILGSLITIRAKILMQTVLGLAVALLGVAGIYFYLGSMFLTLMQILIYVGAICIVLVFGIMVGYTPTEVAEIFSCLIGGYGLCTDPCLCSKNRLDSCCSRRKEFLNGSPGRSVPLHLLPGL